MPECYLTIDDSPSIHTDDMVDFLKEREITAILFCRGDLLEKNPEPIIRAIQNGFIIGNHSYAHEPFGEMSLEEIIIDIEKCDFLINNAYQKANITRLGKYFRFPYLDRGDGDRIERHFENVTDIDINANDKVQEIQNYLVQNNYYQPFKKTNHPYYTNLSIKNAADCLMTFTSYDWMLTHRHQGKWPYQTINDLKQRIDDDQFMKETNGNILLFHDQSETFETFKSLIDHFLKKGYSFSSFP